MKLFKEILVKAFKILSVIGLVSLVIYYDFSYSSVKPFYKPNYNLLKDDQLQQITLHTDYAFLWENENVIRISAENGFVPSIKYIGNGTEEPVGSVCCVPNSVYVNNGWRYPSVNNVGKELGELYGTDSYGDFLYDDKFVYYISIERENSDDSIYVVITYPKNDGDLFERITPTNGIDLISEYEYRFYHFNGSSSSITIEDVNTPEYNQALYEVASSYIIQRDGFIVEYDRYYKIKSEKAKIPLLKKNVVMMVLLFVLCLYKFISLTRKYKPNKNLVKEEQLQYIIMYSPTKFFKSNKNFTIHNNKRDVRYNVTYTSYLNGENIGVTSGFYTKKLLSKKSYDTINRFKNEYGYVDDSPLHKNFVRESEFYFTIGIKNTTIDYPVLIKIKYPKTIGELFDRITPINGIDVLKEYVYLVKMKNSDDMVDEISIDDINNTEYNQALYELVSRYVIQRDSIISDYNNYYYNKKKKYKK